MQRYVNFSTYPNLSHLDITNLSQQMVIRLSTVTPGHAFV